MEQKLFDIYYHSGKLSTDSRKIEKDSIFVCIKGENFDGNRFAQEALDKGAAHVVLDNPQYFSDAERMTLVENSVQFIQDLALHHRRKFSIPVIGITGSNGKTTSKELIHAVLNKKYNTLATEGNLNNHLGVPFTLLRLNESHEIAVIEMGANKPGDIAELCSVAEPTHGIITNIGKAHLEGFGDFEGVLRTKTELYTSVQMSNGTLVVNGDDPILNQNVPSDPKLLKYGTGPKCNVQGELLELTPFVKMNWRTSTYSSPDLETRLIGEYNFYNFLAAATFGILFDVPEDQISEALSEYEPTNKRSQVKRTNSNTLILDCYNANPSSMELALRSFAKNSLQLPKLAIIGGMKELGSESAMEHNKIIDLVRELNIDCITVGDEFIDSPFRHYAKTDDLINELRENPVNGKLILLKGSRGIALERLEEML